MIQSNLAHFQRLHVGSAAWLQKPERLRGRFRDVGGISAASVFGPIS
jgi:hypothetical protein